MWYTKITKWIKKETNNQSDRIKYYTKNIKRELYNEVVLR